MRKFYVLWTYIANYSSLIEVEAKDPEDALRRATYGFSGEFANKAKVYVFDCAPALMSVGGERK